MAYFLLHNGQPSARRLLGCVSRLRQYVSATEVTSSDYIIRYGLSSESDPDATNIMNMHHTIMRTVSRTKMARSLRNVGVRFLLPSRSEVGDTTRFIRHYRIPFFDFEPLTCFRADAGMAWINARIQRILPIFHEVSLSEDKVAVRACYLASRALHALGLDFGLVSLGLGPRGMLHIIDITPAPVLEGRMLELFSQAIEAFIEREEKLAHTGVQNVMLGADIEIMLRNQQGKVVLASTYFSRKGRIGCDNLSIASDGRRLPLVELRPDPSTNPLALVAQLKDALAEGVRKVNRSQVEWRAGSMPFRSYCTGGHIHFSNVALSRQFVKALDNYVGLILMAVEKRETAQQRRLKYGFFGDIRKKEYGGFEYRTPSSFIVSNVVTTAAFCLAYLVALYHRDLPCIDIYSPEIQMAFYRGEVAVLTPIIERNIETISNLPLYDRYREQIDALFDMIRTGQTWNEDIDLRDEWELPKQYAAHSRTHRSRRVRQSG